VKWLLALLAIVACTLSCQLIIGLKDPAEDPLPPDGGPDVAAPIPDAGMDVDPCAHVWPPPMGVDDDPFGDVGTLVFATRTLLVKGRLGWDAGLYDGGGAGTSFPIPQDPASPTAAFGFDLDNSCTCQGDNLHQGQPSCKTNVPSMPAYCDEDGGVDNSLVGFYHTFGSVNGGDPDKLLNINQSISNGNNTILTRISKYNGKANDNEVVVEVALAGRVQGTPITSAECAGAQTRPIIDPGTPEAGPDYGPAWDGCDVWNVLHLASAIPAYVVNHQLVVRAQATLPVLAAGTSFDVSEPQSVGVLVPVPGDDASAHHFTYEDGVFAGRAEASTLIAALLTFHAHAADVLPACYIKDDVSFIKGAVCSNLDLRTSSVQDYYTDDAGLIACNAASFVFSFRQERSNFGVQLQDAAIVNSCIDSGANFSCDSL
jgi:hypothetical protein